MSILALIISFFLILNALGNVPVFVALLSKFPVARQRQIIVREMLIALGIFLAFNFFGDSLLHLLGITRPIIGIAGGTLLFIIALGLIFPRTKDDSELGDMEPLIVPLATPLVAGPGAIATVMIYSEQVGNVWISSGIILAAWFLTFLIFLLSSNIKALIGQKGLTACQRLGGMLIALIAVQMVCSGALDLLKKMILETR
ncbi:MAG: MarC family protein [Verrucomicrobia bacterium]|nr:MarC family protein [Verrucomicrobiota bacterium]